MTTMNEQFVVGLIYDSYPDTDLLNIDPPTESTTLYDLEQQAKDCGDTLFLWIVREIREGCGNGKHGTYTSQEIERVLQRGVSDLRKVIDGLP